MITPHKHKASLLTSWSVVPWTVLNSAWLIESESESESESYLMTDGQSASPSWNKAPILLLGPDFFFQSDNCGFVGVGRPL
jgi:hypothetical protein